jgi:hypothetical protein
VDIDKHQLEELWERFLQQVVKINNLTTENKRLNENLSSIQERHEIEISKINKLHNDELSRLQLQIDKQTIELAKANAQLSSGTKNNNTNDNNMAVAELAKVKAENEIQVKQLQQKISEHAATVAKLEDKNSQLTHNLAQTTEKLSKAENELKEREKLYRLREQANSNESAVVSKLQKEIDTLQGKIKNQEEQISNLKAEIKDKEAEIERLNKMIEERDESEKAARDKETSDSKAAAGKEQLLQQKVDKLEKMLRDLQTELVLKKQSLKKATKESDKKSTEIKGLKEKLESALTRNRNNKDDDDSDDDSDEDDKNNNNKGKNYHHKGKSDDGDAEAVDKLKRKIYAVQQQLEETVTIDNAIFLSPTNTSNPATEAGAGSKALVRMLRESASPFADERLFQHILNSLSFAISRAQKNSEHLSYQVALLSHFIKDLITDREFSNSFSFDAQLISILSGIEKKGISLDAKVDDEVDNESVQSLFLRQLYFHLRKAYVGLCKYLMDGIAPLLFPTVLRQPGTSGGLASPLSLLPKARKTLARSKKSSLIDIDEISYDQITHRLAEVTAHLSKAGAFPAILQEYMTTIFWSMNVQMFNTLLDRPDLCTCSNAFQMKYALSQLSSWVFTPSSARIDNSHDPHDPSAATSQTTTAAASILSEQFSFLDPDEIVDQLSHMMEATNILLAEKALFSNKQDINKHFHRINFLQMKTLLLAFRPDNMSPTAVPEASKEFIKRVAIQEHEEGRSLYLRDPLM